MTDLTVDYVRSELEYRAETGELFWKNRRRGVQTHRAAGSPAVQGKYTRVRIAGQNILSHRLIWFHVHGRWPVQIDHINRDGLDNRISNLREATYAQNLANRRKFKSNTTGHVGVRKFAGCVRWSAIIFRDRKMINLGLFDTPAEAGAAYRAALAEINGKEFVFYK